MVTLRLMSLITEVSSLPGWLALQPAMVKAQINATGTHVIFIGDLSLLLLELSRCCLKNLTHCALHTLPKLLVPCSSEACALGAEGPMHLFLLPLRRFSLLFLRNLRDLCG